MLRSSQPTNFPPVGAPSDSGSPAHKAGEPSCYGYGLDKRDAWLYNYFDTREGGKRVLYGEEE